MSDIKRYSKKEVAKWVKENIGVRYRDNSSGDIAEMVEINRDGDVKIQYNDEGRSYYSSGEYLYVLLSSKEYTRVYDMDNFLDELEDL